MNNDILFTEHQRFNQWWLWLMLIVINGLLTYGVVTQPIMDREYGEKPAGNMELLVIFSIICLLTFSFFLLKLETVIKKDGVYVKFFPFHFSYKYYPWNQIKNAHIRKYNPILEYGGWGIRGLGKNKALNVSGNQGLQLEFEDNKKLLIGTRKPEELSVVLRSVLKKTA